MKGIEEEGVYTTAEIQRFLKISESTMKRLLKKGLIRANKIGGQYRILGREILYLVSPRVEKEVESSYRGLKSKIVKKVTPW